MKDTKKITVGGIKYKINLLDAGEWMRLKRKASMVTPFLARPNEIDICNILLSGLVSEPVVTVDDFKKYGVLEELIKACVELQN
jgi:hypothetical protein